MTKAGLARGVGHGRARTPKRASFLILSNTDPVEYWKVEGVVALVTRQANVGWLERSFEERGLTVERRVAGQFSEACAMASAAPLRKLIHGFDSFWFRRVESPGPAYGNVLFLRKKR